MDIAVLLSGGVDSSVALKLLIDAGYKPQPFYLKIWLEDELSFLGSCPWQQDLEYAQGVCEQLHVPLEVVSLQREYWDAVIHTILQQIKQGLTPNPDMLCNARVKFGAFTHVLPESMMIATGHYAQHKVLDGQDYLCMAPDPVKDQTYFLSQLTKNQLKRSMFPIGHLCKSQVRLIALEANLPTATRKDSQGVCFLGKISFAEFIKHHCGVMPGKMIEFETGTVLGTHEGFWFYTIGQRRGSGLAGGPWYVVSKNIDENIVYVSRTYDQCAIQRCHARVKNINWLTYDPFSHGNQEKKLWVKLRHGPSLVACMIKIGNHGLYDIILDAADQGIAPGQYAVFYDKKGDEMVCLGGGVLSAMV
jgi:tRNA-specific 2-thiouridylase